MCGKGNNNWQGRVIVDVYWFFGLWLFPSSFALLEIGRRLVSHGLSICYFPITHVWQVGNSIWLFLRLLSICSYSVRHRQYCGFVGWKNVSDNLINWFNNFNLPAWTTMHKRKYRWRCRVGSTLFSRGLCQWTSLPHNYRKWINWPML